MFLFGRELRIVVLHFEYSRPKITRKKRRIRTQRRAKMIMPRSNRKNSPRKRKRHD